MIELAVPVAGDRFRGLGKLIKDQNTAGYSLGEHLRRIYMESDTNIAVLSARRRIHCALLERPQPSRDPYS